MTDTLLTQIGSFVGTKIKDTRAFATSEATAAASAAQSAAINAIRNGVVTDGDDLAKLYALITSVSGTVNGLSNPFNLVGDIVGGADSANAFDISTLTEKDGGDAYVITTAGFVKDTAAGTAYQLNVHDMIVFDGSGNVIVMDHTNATSSGTTDEITVSGSTATGFTISLASAFKTRMSNAETSIAAVGSYAEFEAAYTASFSA